MLSVITHLSVISVKLTVLRPCVAYRRTFTSLAKCYRGTKDKNTIRRGWSLYSVYMSWRLNIYPTCSRRMSVRIFEGKDHAKLYAQFRPTYPDTVYKTIANHCEGPTCKFDLAVDVGCGSGQSTLPLTNYFQRVIGSDVSAEQISNAEAKDHEKATFRVGTAEDLSFLENNSVQLVTVAQAFHWFEHHTFYAEVTRVLRPGGVLAVYGYALPRVDNEEAQRLLIEYHGDLLKTYWDKGRKYVDNMYRDFALPYPGWERLDSDDLAIRRTMPVGAYIGYLSTFSAWRKYIKDHPESDHLQRMRQRLLELYKTSPEEDEPVMRVTWPVFMLLGRKPIT